MSKVRAHLGITLDGYVTGPNQSPEKPFGDGAEHMNDWLFALASARKLFGQEGGETGPSDDVFRERLENVGAVVMGRKMFGGGPGPWGHARWGNEQWNGWWGEDPPYHAPVFVLTHHARASVAMKGGTTFHFMTEGAEHAFAQAKTAAGTADVLIAGGAHTVQQYLGAGLIDELELHLVPMLLGAGERLFDGVTQSRTRLEQIRVVAGNGVTHLKYAVRK
ncbi:MAG TPA: dihydrofolate reductase family protein [Polyangiaceae bacterium]|jgi:dihydrofolate reductase